MEKITKETKMIKKEILSDEPINKPEEDILGREEFAKNLADSLTLWKK